MKTTTCKACGRPIVWIRTTKGKSMPCDAEPVAYREYLDKQKLLMALNEKYQDMSCMPASYYAGFQYAIKLIERLHVGEEVAPVVHGKWELRHEGYGHYWECSVCNTNPCIYVTRNTKFCPNCGAKMDLEDDE